MIDELRSQTESSTEKSVNRSIRRDGPFWLAIGLAVAGGLYMLFGSVTILPWISDERRRESIRHVWLELSRDLPDIGHPTLEKIGFWILVVAAGALCVGLMILASNVRDGDEPGTGEPA